MSLDNHETIQTVIKNKKSGNVYFCVEDGRPFNQIKDAAYKLQKRIWKIKMYIQTKEVQKKYGEKIKIFFACIEEPPAEIKKLLKNEEVDFGIIGSKNFTKSME